MSKINIGNYYPQDSIIHRIDPRAKISLAIVLMIIIFFLDSPLSLAVYGIGVITLIILAKIDLKTVWQTIKPLLFFTIFAFIINLFSIPGETLFTIGPLHASTTGLFTGLLMAVRLMFLVIATAILMTLTTTSFLLADSIESLLRPLKVIKVPVHDIAMMISIALRFIPTLADEADKITKAQSSRGANYDTGGFMQKIRGLVTILIPLFVSAIKRAEELAIAMEARCYRGDIQRSKYKPLRMQSRDYVFIAVAAVFVILVLCVQFFLG